MNKKWFLYATEFFSGMSVMAIELGASRLLAPYFSSSQIVWTIIIGTIMIAMAIGNVIGGKIADKNQNPTLLYFLILLVSIWVALIPLVGKYIIGLVSVVLALIVKSGFLIWASLLSCLLIFVPPLLVLGTVTPQLVKYSTKSLDNNGKTIGYLEALQTIGSIIGTFLPTFVTIPTVGTAFTFIIFAVILFVISLLFFIFERKHIVKCCIAGLFIIGAFVGAFFFNFSFFTGSIIHQDESIYNYLEVDETEDDYRLSTNILFGVQSVKTKADGLTGMYYDYALGACGLTNLEDKGEDANVLILGFGCGTYATLVDYYYPDVNIEGVEIDKKIVDISHDFFAVPEKVQIQVNDGRTYISDKNNTTKYDVIMVDAYQDVTIPFQMSSIEFFTYVKDHLTEDGVMVVNMNMYYDGEGNLNKYLIDTIGAVFKNVKITKVNYSMNVELFAYNDDTLFDDYKVATIANYDLKRVRNKVFNNLEEVEIGNLLLTDDKAPVELLGMSVLDDIIRDELTDLKEQIKGKSFKELVEMLR